MTLSSCRLIYVHMIAAPECMITVLVVFLKNVIVGQLAEINILDSYIYLNEEA